MPTKVSLAVAGSGKTQMLADLISGLSASATSAAITFTTTGQDELSERVVNSGRPNHETYGWFSFLVNHIIKPYVPAIFPGVHARGLAFVNSSAEIQRSRAGWKYYFDDRHQPYSVRLSLLAKKIINDTGGAPIRRLEGIYSHLFIDEVQDLGGNDLEVLRALMASDI
jgi:DNA helicase-2/ATP-dependent DNA helicase PcrA